MAASSSYKKFAIAILGMKFAIVTREKHTKKRICAILKETKHQLSKKPDFVIVAGGDGTILYSERLFPGIPKIPLRDNSVCKKCYSEVTHLVHVLKQIKEKKFSIEKQIKLETIWEGKKLIALNEIQIRNKLPFEAIRFELSVGKKTITDIGDGAIISTSHGSSGYYYSATGKTFSKGIGIAFNNSHKRNRSFVVPENSAIRIKLIRGVAYVASDNNKSMLFTIKKDKNITIRKSKQTASFVVLD